MRQTALLLGMLAAAGCGKVTDKLVDATPSDAAVDMATVDTGADPDLIVDLDARMGVTLNASSKVTAWADQSPLHNDAVAPAGPAASVTSANATINGTARPVLRFDGTSYLAAPPTMPMQGTLFLLYANGAAAGRIVGWESYASGTSGLGLDTGQGTAKMLLIARRGSASGDLQGSDAATTFELDVVSWGSAGTTLERHKTNAAVETRASATFTMVGDSGYKLHVGSSGDQLGLFKGDLAIVRVYKRQMNEADRTAIAIQLMP